MDEEERRDHPVQPAPLEQTPLPRPPEPLAMLFAQHHGEVLRAAYRVTGNPMDAEDVLQTVFVRLLRREDEIDLSQTARGYLKRAAVNAALDLLRARKRNSPVPLGEVEAGLVDANEPGPDRRSSGRELAALLRRALSRIPPGQAEIFALRYFEELDNLEIARLLGRTQTSIAVILHRVRHRLRRELRAPQGELS